MRRCCFFFLAFLAVVFLAVATGAFHTNTGINSQLGDITQASVESQDEYELPKRNSYEADRVGIFKKSEP